MALSGGVIRLKSPSTIHRGVALQVYLLLHLSLLAAPDRVRAAAPTLLTSAKAVKEAGSPTPPGTLPVQLRATVSFVNSSRALLFVQDASGGVYCESGHLKDFPLPGHRVLVEGFAGPGSFLPIVVPSVIHDLGAGDPLVPAAVTGEDLWQGRHDGDLVQLSAFVTEATLMTNGPARLHVQLVSGGRPLDADIFGPPPGSPADYLYSQVRLRGVFGANGDGNGHVVDVGLLVQDPGGLILEQTAAELTRQAPYMGFRELQTVPMNPPPGILTRTRGTVNLVSGESLWIGDAERGIHVQLQRPYGVMPGEQVEVAGFLRGQGRSREIAQARILSRAPGTRIAPTPASSHDLYSSRRQGAVVRTEGTLLHRVPEAMGDLLVLHDTDDAFEVRLPAIPPNVKAPRVQPGARIQVTGVLSWVRGSVGARGTPQVLLSRMEDLQEVAPAPWPLRRTLWVVTCLSVAIGIGFVVLYLAHRRLRDATLGLQRRDQALRELNQDLGRRIAERTEELEQANRRLRVEIAERRHAQAELADREALFRGCFELPVFGMAVIALDHSWIQVNDRLCQLLGYSRESLSRLTWSALVHPEEAAVHDGEFGRVVRGESEGYSLNTRFLREDARVVHVAVTLRAVRHRSGAPDHCVAIIRDRTEDQRAEEARVRLESQLRQAHKLEAVGTLAGGIAHDFNNILGSIIGFTELARTDGAGNARVEEDLSLVLQATRRAKELVHRILAFSRQQKIEPRIVRPGPLLEETVKLLRAATPASTRLELQPLTDLPCIKADASQFQQVVMNLATNSIQAVESVPEPQVQLSAGALMLAAGDLPHPDLRPGLHLHLMVADNGPGIDPAILSRIFDPFFTTKTPGEGTGLGLSVVDGIVRHHHGAVVVDSRPGAGTTFHVYLPAEAQAPEPDAAPEKPAPTGRGQHVLFVDDEAPLCLLGRRIMERAGYTVTTKPNAADAYAAFKAQPSAVDLLITDLAMPGTSGLALIRTLRDLRPDLPVVLTTGRVDPAVEFEVQRLGGIEILLKPSDVQSLTSAAARALGRLAARNATEIAATSPPAPRRVPEVQETT